MFLVVVSLFVYQCDLQGFFIIDLGILSIYSYLWVFLEFLSISVGISLVDFTSKEEVLACLSEIAIILEVFAEHFGGSWCGY